MLQDTVVYVRIFDIFWIRFYGQTNARGNDKSPLPFLGEGKKRASQSRLEWQACFITETKNNQVIRARVKREQPTRI